MLPTVRSGLMSLRLRCLSLSLSNFIVVLVILSAFPAASRSQAQPYLDSPAFGQPSSTPSTSNTASSQQSENLETAVDQQAEPGNVVIDGRTLLQVYQPVGSFTAADRAEKISERILTAAKRGADPKTVALTERHTWTEISVEGGLLLAITDEDARLAGKQRAELAAEDAEIIRQTLVNYKSEHNWRSIVRGSIYSLVATLLLLLTAFVVRKLHLLIRVRLERWLERHKASEHKQTAPQIAITYIVSTLLAFGSVLRWFLFIAIFEIYITVVLSFFPQTRAVSYAVTGWIFSSLRSMGRSALEYLPNLFVIAVVLIIYTQVSRLITLVFDEVEKGNLSITGFYPEWAKPSSKLIRLMVFVLLLVIIFPYLPGSKSPAFQGISIFVGVLLSLGSSSAVANAIAGVILMYMRSFSVGDWVKIGDVIGEVQERSMWVTRILTQKQETITIPNATVMNGAVLNYTREAMKTGVIFYTTVTIGYDAPWKTVHQLLLDAAFATQDVLQNPAPFVLQSQLNDFYVAYELNAYTDNPKRMQFIYSDLHQNIQDRFNDAGVEICSPHFAAVRDGNTIAIPAQYIPQDYTAPGFRVDGKKEEAPQTAASGR